LFFDDPKLRQMNSVLMDILPKYERIEMC